MDMRRLFLYCMIGAVLALASGCGGNGGGTGMMAGGGGTPPGGGTPGGGGTTPPPPTNPVSLSDLLMGYMTVPAGNFTVNAGQSLDRGHATFSCPAGGANCMIMVAADGTVTSRGGRATAMPSQAAQDAKMVADKRTAGINMALGRNFLTVLAVEQTPFFITPTFQPLENTRVVTTPETWDADYAPLPGIAIGRAWVRFVDQVTPANTPVRRPIVTPAVPNPLGDTLGQEDTGVADAIEFRKQGMNTRVGAFTGEVHTRSMRAGNTTTTDEITIYHDKQASGPVKWNEYYAMGSTVDNRVNGGGTPTGSNVLLGSGTFAATNTRPAVTDVAYGLSTAALNGILKLKSDGATGATNVLTAAETALLVSSELPSAESQTFTYGAGARNRTFDGTFNGVPGKFNCTGTTTCSATRNANGTLQLRAAGATNSPFGGPVLAGWFFTPTAKANEILLPGLDHDTDYLVFGTWLKTVEQPGRDTTYDIAVISSGSTPFGNDTGGGTRDNQQIQDLRGKATYTGSAAGRYGLRVLAPNGSVGRSSTGSFAAKATLTAQFGDTSGNTSVNDVYSIKGMITDFTDPSNPGTNLSAWSVELGRAKFGHVTGAPSSLVGREQSTFPFVGGNVPNTGNMNFAQGRTGTTPGPLTNWHRWVGRFYGPAAPSGASAAVKASTYPTGVTGTFRAAFPNGDAVGAFGATLKE